ncbi:Crp/Fnr family transcriptional regulator [Zobellia laminariae]|uniref:Crp/Fnr family transcriptional regulator n=1 Tax=Zobellia laminariae TaxID=248906 RepID=UPI0012D8A3A7|nr:Crp/Fnr family transcriptional regulator [Zobellia laminariae]MUH39603.1 Crp/Fnr family transcriptional regulator [Zobellia laminariae]WKX77894.1 Crp/Fnr family transcriptional regulator [Zobellia laminariae]
MISISNKISGLTNDVDLVNTACMACSNEYCLIKRNMKSSVGSTFVKQRKEIRCKKGQQFIMEGAAVTGLFFVLKGKVKVLRTGLHGKEQIVRFAKEGEIIGHRGFGTEESYTISAVALEDCTLCYFSKENLQEVLRTEPTFTYDLMLFYANELNKSEAKVKTLSQMSVRERVIDTLLYVHRKFGQQHNFISILLSRREYADYAGTTEEQVIRVFSALKKEELIVTKGKHIGIIDTSLLQQEISEHNFYLDS